MADQIVLYEARYPAAIITLNNPDHRNALSSAMIDALMAAIARAEQDRRVRALVFTGTGSAFSAGMDLGELRTMLDQLRVDESGKVWDGALRGEALIERVYRLGKPSIAAVNGVAVGNGAGFLSACDLAVAADSARIGYTEMKHGIQAGMVILHLMRLVGERVAQISAADRRTGDRRSGQGSRTDQQVVPAGQLMETALAWADAIAMNAPKAEAITKSLMCKFSGQAIAMSMTEYTAAPHITDETRWGLESFFDKKPVPWSLKPS